jgi:Pirin C-terminal cupin domain
MRARAVRAISFGWRLKTSTTGARHPLLGDHPLEDRRLESGEIDVAGDRFGEGRLLVFKPGDRISVPAVAQSRLIVLGGEPMDGPRHIWWNFVHSSQERIDQAKEDWRAKRFGLVPGDEKDFIPQQG